ncbi:MAG: hypothetical protein AB1384_01285 [Actinomycetota bacterium]
MKRTLLPLAVTVLVLSGLVASGCGGSSGAAQTADLVDPDAKQVTVEEIARDPEAFDSVIVTTEGDYAVGYCSACFLLKDGVHAVRVEVSDTAPLPPESKLHTRMQVTGKIYVAQGSPNIVAESIVYK